MSRNLRKSSIVPGSDITRPQSERDDVIFFKNRYLRRKRVVLLTRGCTIATCTMCPLPNESLDTKLCSIGPDDIIEQFDFSFRRKQIDSYELVTVFNNGNFFVDDEIPPKARLHIYKRVRESRASILAVESLPQFINVEKIDEARKFLGDKQLAVSIGLQSSDDMVRKFAINTTCTKVGFEKAVTLLAKNNYTALTFLMLKPPFLTESEAIYDAVESIRYVSGLGIDNPVLCATRVAPNTIVDLMYDSGYFHPPWLWSVVEVLKRIEKLNLEIQPIVATSELKADQNLGSVCSKNCTNCSDYLVGAIERFNVTRDFKPIEAFRCGCYEEYEKFLSQENIDVEGLSLEKRVGNFLNNYNK